MKKITTLALAAIILVGSNAALFAVLPTQTGQEMMQNADSGYAATYNNPQMQNPDQVFSNPNANPANGNSRDFDVTPRSNYNTTYPRTDYYTRQSYTAPPPVPVYSYGYYGSLPPPTPNQAFPDKAQSDALYNYIRSR